jgi:hypothetical protein
VGSRVQLLYGLGAPRKNRPLSRCPRRSRLRFIRSGSAPPVNNFCEVAPRVKHFVVSYRFSSVIRLPSALLLLREVVSSFCSRSEWRVVLAGAWGDSIGGGAIYRAASTAAKAEYALTHPFLSSSWGTSLTLF